MHRPDRLWDQYAGKAAAEMARGSGLWPLQPHPCALEPPWEPFDREALTLWDCMFTGWQAPWEPSWLKRTLFPGAPAYDPGRPVHLPEVSVHSTDDLARVTVEQYPDDDSTIPKAEELLRSLTKGLSRPVAFELVGLGPLPEYDYELLERLLLGRGAGPPSPKSHEAAITGWTPGATRVQFVAHRTDAPRIERLLLAHYPRSAVIRHASLTGDPLSDIAGDVQGGRGWASTVRLEDGYCFPLRTFTRLDPDPLGVAVAAMEDLGRREWALVQVLFQPARADWGRSLGEAVIDPYKGDFLIGGLSEKVLRDKFASPLFAASVRIAACREDVFRQLKGWAEQYAAPPQTLDYELDDEEAQSLSWAVQARCTYRPGVLLNTQELSGLVHLPGKSVASERLGKVKTRTQPAREAAAGPGSVLLGENVHRGQVRQARLPAKLRERHCYLAGASGTGKSTLMLGMILQDIEAGAGVGLLDPHGDLVRDVLKRIPEDRVDDVVLFDPADTEHPFALNILEAKDEPERERIVAEMLLALSRYFPDSWGPRLERILTFTLLTALEAIPQATLADVERLLTEEPFRSVAVSRLKTPRYAAFWGHEYPLMARNAADPVLNKLSVFLLNRTVRNIISQRRSALDFDALINGRKILLANLSTGLLTERISGMLGNFLVAKLVNAAFRRAAIPEEEREPWYLYVDEFQSFMNLSMGFERILAEARKYKLVLAGLANQYVGQLSGPVRDAIFGNVGTMAVFRLGTNDANVVARELGAFTAEEILALEVGEAVVRAGSSASVFNVRTHPAPPEAGQDPTPRIRAAARAKYARPRHVVEAQLAGHGQTHSAGAPTASHAAASPQRQPAPGPNTNGAHQTNGHSPPGTTPAGGSRRGRAKARRASTPPPPPPSDPREDDLIF